jgi:hypothetical protein
VSKEGREGEENKNIKRGYERFTFGKYTTPLHFFLAAHSCSHFVALRLLTTGKNSKKKKKKKKEKGRKEKEKDTISWMLIIRG